MKNTQEAQKGKGVYYGLHAIKYLPTKQSVSEIAIVVIYSFRLKLYL